MLEEKIKKALELVRPSLQSHGGDVEFVSVAPDGVVSLKMMGRCSQCPSAQMTIKNVVEDELKREVPEVSAVLAV